MWDELLSMAAVSGNDQAMTELVTVGLKALGITGGVIGVAHSPLAKSIGAWIQSRALPAESATGDQVVVQRHVIEALRHIYESLERISETHQELVRILYDLKSEVAITKDRTSRGGG